MNIIIPQNDVPNVDTTRFQGDSEYNIIGMYYLSHKEPHNLCVIYGEPYQPDNGINVNVSKKTSPHHHTDDCVKLPQRSLSEIPGRQTDVSLRWIQKDNRISVPKPVHKFWENFTHCSEKRFVTCPFGFNCNEFGHANYLLFDKVLKTLERFESFGEVTGNCISDTDVDIKIEELFRENLPYEYKNFRYIRPLNILPKHNVQSEQESEDRWVKREEQNNPVGFCSVWSIWYIDLRTSNPDVEPENLIKIAIKKIKEIEEKRKNRGFGKGSFTDFIRRYSLILVDLKEKLEQEYKKNKRTKNNIKYNNNSSDDDDYFQSLSIRDGKKNNKSGKKTFKKENLNLSIVDIPGKGKGVITLSNIEKGTCIIEYGNIRFEKSYNHTCKECLGKKWSCKKHDRLMLLPDKSWLDCDEKELSGYINHNNINPNCELKTKKDQNDKKLHVFIYSKKDISKGHEIDYNYYN